MINIKKSNIELPLQNNLIKKIIENLENYIIAILFPLLSILSIWAFYYFYKNGLGLAYNDSRSHLDIARRVVEGLKPGLAQLGSVWLPLPHVLMIPTIWNDFMWHSGLSGSLISMVSFVGTGIFIYLILKELHANLFARLIGVFVFAANLNILYLQSTAMTELLLLFTMTAAVYELIVWYKNDSVFNLIKSAFWIMLSTLNRYDGWFLYGMASIVVVFHTYKKKGFQAAEGMFILLSTLAAFGMFLWFLWNLLIFKDPLYFAFGPYSAHAQQQQLASAGNLATQGNIILSTKIYLYSMLYGCGAFFVGAAAVALAYFSFDKKIEKNQRISFSLLFITPLIFNILALFFGFSVLFIQGISGDTWFNVRYGVMMMPSIAILFGYLIGKLKDFRWIIICLLIFVSYFSFSNFDAVTIDDARVGSSQKNVTEVAGWLHAHAKDQKGFILVSAASHDAIIFSSGLPMKRFIHEGTGAYWDLATGGPEHWARWIVLRTYDDNDQTYRLVKNTVGFKNDYTLVSHFPFADIYEIKPQYLGQLNSKPILGNQK